MNRIILFFILSIPLIVRAQVVEQDPCGHPPSSEVRLQAWAYPIDEFIVDLHRWASEPVVEVNTIGRSVQGRFLYMLTLTNPASSLPKRRVHVHARTHPNESESSFVTKEMLDELLSDSPLARILLDHCVFHFIPLYNPDGVHLVKPRENANGIDIESNWNTFPHQPEVEALKDHFTDAMKQNNPIEVALNMHSAYNCKRYFVYHAATGTSQLFTQYQQRFIDMVRSRFPGGIEPYNYFVTWTGSTPLQYPESWFWTHHRESVMALTYEDMNCAAAGDYDHTARALLGGVGEYLGILGAVTTVEEIAGSGALTLDAVYPNPVSSMRSLSVRFSVPFGDAPVRLRVLDPLGRETVLLWDGPASSVTRTLQWTPGHIASGVYIVELSGRGITRRMPVIIVR